MAEIELAATQGLARWATYREAMAQPAIWRAWADPLAHHAEAASAWLRTRQHGEVWFCGAGTSAFIGDTLCAYLNGTARRGTRFRAIPTTDLVSCPRDFIRAGERAGDGLLVTSFGRSGDSPETAGTLDLLDAHLPGADRLHFTCNPRGGLATRIAPGAGEQRLVLLPLETNDSGFAMTSSYSTMLLSALACFDENPPVPPRSALLTLADAADDVLGASARLLLRHPAPPSRAVFLGSGVLTASARESALKVLELTAGRVPTSWDSTLGFRHGPKAVVDGDTRVHVLVSNHPHTRRYDLDAAREIGRQFGARALVTLGSDASAADLVVPFVGNDAWTSVLHVLAAQIQAIGWSDKLALNVDDPFGGSTLSRVVQGVRLYPLDGAS